LTLAMAYTGSMGIVALIVWYWCITIRNASMFPEACDSSKEELSLWEEMKEIPLRGWLCFFLLDNASSGVLILWVFGVDLLVENHGFELTEANFIFSTNSLSAMSVGVLIAYTIRNFDLSHETCIIVMFIFFPLGFNLIFYGQGLVMILIGIIMCSTSVDLLGSCWLLFAKYVPVHLTKTSSEIVTSGWLGISALNTAFFAWMIDEYSWDIAMLYFTIPWLLMTVGMVYLRVYGPDDSIYSMRSLQKSPKMRSPTSSIDLEKTFVQL